MSHIYNWSHDILKLEVRGGENFLPVLQKMILETRQYLFIARITRLPGTPPGSGYVAVQWSPSNRVVPNVTENGYIRSVASIMRDTIMNMSPLCIIII